MSPDEYIQYRRSFLNGPEPFRAFALRPDLDYWPLREGASNDAAVSHLRENGLDLVSVETLGGCTLGDFPGQWLIFGIVEDPYTRIRIAWAREEVLAGRATGYGVAFVDKTPADLRNELDVAGLAHAYTLPPSSRPFVRLLARVPLAVRRHDSGELETFEGLPKRSA
jgi:hypothetical protein